MRLICRWGIMLNQENLRTESERTARAAMGNLETIPLIGSGVERIGYRNRAFYE